MNGLLVVDKPGGMTSRDVVNRVQKWFPRKTKIGHTGTLDPLATGVLVICIGAATRLADYVQEMSKSYSSRFLLGASSTTDDADGVVTLNSIESLPSRQQIEMAIAAFVGRIDQLPPAFSALKVSGQRAHVLARQGSEVKLSSRPVRIDAIRMKAYEWPLLDVEIDCGKGTYIRSIARDLGTKLGCGGMVQTLRRTRIGPFVAAQGIELDVDPGNVRLLPLTAALEDMIRMRIDPESERRFRCGQSIQDSSRGFPDKTVIAVMNEIGELIGIAKRVGAGIHPTIVLNL
jgi:tRNA pseudouridine55 synthase